MREQSKKFNEKKNKPLKKANNSRVEEYKN